MDVVRKKGEKKKTHKKSRGNLRIWPSVRKS